jgi:hypothetical protein
MRIVTRIARRLVTRILREKRKKLCRVDEFFVPILFSLF